MKKRIISIILILLLCLTCLPVSALADDSSTTDIESLVEQAKALLEAEEYEEAIPLLKQAADLGSAVAQNNLGVCYGLGLGVDQDYEKAVEYLRLAADQGMWTCHPACTGLCSVTDPDSNCACGEYQFETGVDFVFHRNYCFFYTVGLAGNHTVLCCNRFSGCHAAGGSKRFVESVGDAGEYCGVLKQDEIAGSRAVLRAAALTYVAALAASILNLIRLVAIAGRRR